MDPSIHKNFFFQKFFFQKFFFSKIFFYKFFFYKNFFFIIIKIFFSKIFFFATQNFFFIKFFFQNFFFRIFFGTCRACRDPQNPKSDCARFGGSSKSGSWISRGVLEPTLENPQKWVLNGVRPGRKTLALFGVAKIFFKNFFYKFFFLHTRQKSKASISPLFLGVFWCSIWDAYYVLLSRDA
jgi:hypothetical protein